MPSIMTFQDAIASISGAEPKVLLGNGFSRACRNDIFAYDALFDRADFTSLSSQARQAFTALRTTDFELVMRSLRHAETLVRLYSPSDAALADTLARDAEALRSVLVRAIADSHPAHPGEISEEKYASCRSFLSRFSAYYTLNYDLLLYWALMHTDQPPPLNHDDGFRTPDDGPEDFVTWDIEKTNRMNVFYLHGALHLFDAGSELVKYTWINTGIRLIDQIRAALDNDLYPLFVAEGKSAQKYERIRHSDFLSRAYRSFANIGNTLFVYGHSFDENDDHILKLIAKGKIRALYVSIFGDPDSDANQRIMRRAEALGINRSARNQLFVRFYDAESAQVWG